MKESKNVSMCNKCILVSSYPTINYDENGECNFCKSWNTRWENFDLEKQSKALDSILDSFRGKTKPYDCIIGLSGGKDSCYAAYFMKQKGMKPLTVTFANGFLSEIAISNIYSVVEALSLPHVMVKPEWDVMKRWYRHFLVNAGEFCSACSFGIRAAIYRIAKSYGIRLIIAGTSPRTEANSPKEFFTASDGYFNNIAKIGFSKEEINGFRYLNQAQRVIWHVRKNPAYLQLPNYVDWQEQKMLKIMKEQLNWGGNIWEQHADCVMNDAKDYLKLKKYGVTEKAAKLSSLIRDKQLEREKALEIMGFSASYIQLYENGELEKRIATGYEILRDCNLCPRECGINRLDGEKGVCRSGKNIMISSAGPHFGEERPLVGRHGSGTIFLTNCNLACIFCQNYDISHLGYGRDSNSEDLAKIMLGLQKMGCHNINFVTPTHYVPQILAALPIAVKDGLKIPLVYNCGGYESMNTIKLLEGVFDVYMPDIKYGNNSMAEKYSKAPKYFDFAVKAVTDMYRQVGDLVINSEGICEKGLLVRHLVLPDDIAKTKEVMEFLSMLSRNTYINIMEQYHPEYKAYQFPELNRRITHKEFENAISIARSFGLKRGFPDEPKRYL